MEEKKIEGVTPKTDAKKAQELERLRKWVKKILPEDYDKIDVLAETDSTLTYEENKSHLRELLKVLIKDLESQADYTKAQQEQLETEKVKKAEAEVVEYNKTVKFEENKGLDEFYAPISRGVNKLCQGYSNLLFIRGRGGIGKCIVLNTKSDFVLSGDGNMMKIEDKPTEVVVMNDEFKLEKAKVNKYYEREVGEVLELTTRTNRKILLTPEHPLYTIMGWKQTKNIKVGEFIATPRRYDLGLTKEIEECKVKLIAYLIAEGSLRESITFTNTDKDLVNDFRKAASDFDERLYLSKNNREGYMVVGNFKRGKHTLIKYLKSIGLSRLKSGDKFIPNEIMQLSDRQIRQFLSILYACDGCVEKSQITYCTKSEVLARQIQHLLLRFGVISTIYEKQKCATNTVKKIKRTYYEIYVAGRESRLNFIDKIGISKMDKKEKLKGLKNRILSTKGNENIDVIPRDVWKMTKIENWAEIGRKLGTYAIPKHAHSFTRDNNSRYNIKKIGELENNELLIKLGNSDIFWDRVKSVRSLTKGFKVYDIEVDHPSHNFIANDIIVHNSYQIRKALVQNKENFVEICGDVTEAYLYRLIFENNGKIIWFKDTAKLLQGLGSVNLLKSACETEDQKILTKSNYSKEQDDLPDKFLCKSKFIFDYNNIFGSQLKEDFEALTSRGDYKEVPLSDDDVKRILRLVAKDGWEKEVTNMVIGSFEANGMVKLNLRTQWKAFKTYKYAKKNVLDWRKELEEELKNISKTRAMLYTLIGNKAMKTADLKRLLLRQEVLSTLRTADRKINEWLYLEELYKVSEGEKDFYVCINNLKEAKT